MLSVRIIPRICDYWIVIYFYKEVVYFIYVVKGDLPSYLNKELCGGNVPHILRNWIVIIMLQCLPWQFLFAFYIFDRISVSTESSCWQLLKLIFQNYVSKLRVFAHSLFRVKLEALVLQTNYLVDIIQCWFLKI